MAPSRRARARNDRDEITQHELSKRLDLLRALGIFRGIDESAFTDLAHSMHPYRASSGEVVVREGRLPTYLYVVAEGRLDVFSSGESGGAPTKVNELGPGDLFGEVGLLEGMPSTASVVAGTDCDLYRIHGADFLRSVAMSEALSDALLERVAGRLEATHPSYQPAVVVSSSRPALSFGGPVADELLGCVESIADMPEEKRATVVAAIKRLVADADRED